MPDDNLWIEIARTGAFTDSQGREQVFTEKDLSDIANAYNPKDRDCPLVFGHPKSDSAPAFGWASKIKAENGKLLAQFAQVSEEVRELVAKGHYRHVSMSLMPDRVTLRHVALLGAAQPAISGLKAVELQHGGDGVTVDFSNSNKDGIMPENELQRKIGQLEEQLKALTAENAALKAQAKEGKDAKEKQGNTLVADGEKKAAEAEEKAKKIAADFAAYRQKVEGEKREARISALVASGKITPAEKAGILEFAAALANLENGAIELAAQGSAAAPKGSKPDFTSGEAMASVRQDGGPSQNTLVEKYLRDLEARTPDGRIADFSANHSPESAKQDAAINPDELTAKL